MENKRYEINTGILTSNNFIPSNWIFEYLNDPLAELFDRFYKFAQDNLDHHCEEYDIKPSTFFYKNDTTINAAAGRIKDHSIIFINNGTMETMYNFLYLNNNAFFQDRYLKTHYADFLPLNTPPGYIMYQVTMQFTYYHELAHVIQKSPQLTSFITEAYGAAGMGGGYQYEQHLREFDADLHAAQMNYLHIHEFWERLTLINQTSENLGKLVSLTLSGMLFYFGFLGGFTTPLYFEASDHPHPLIRVTYIIDIFLERAKQLMPGVQLDSGLILREAFNVTERICRVNGHANIVEGFAETLAKSYPEIEAYVNKLIADSNLRPDFVKNRNKTKTSD
jgi:hypothetical protein